MATLTAARKAEIAKELRVASTWVAGPRTVKLLALANELEGTSADEADEKAEQDAVDAAAKGGPATGTPDPDLADARDKGSKK